MIVMPAAAILTNIHHHDVCFPVICQNGRSQNDSDAQFMRGIAKVVEEMVGESLLFWLIIPIEIGMIGEVVRKGNIVPTGRGETRRWK
jgi:hypothetical protein